jgi:hypothetical protein
MKLKRLMATAAAVVAVTGLGVAVPEAAYASGSPACTSWAYNGSPGPGGEYHTPIGYKNGVRTRGCYMQQGSTGPAVLVMQEALNACFGQNISTDGQFGPNTKAALRNAQSYLNSILGNISVDGEYGPQTASQWFDAAYQWPHGHYIVGNATCVWHNGLDDGNLVAA